MKDNKKQYYEQLIELGKKDLGISDKEARESLNKLIKLGVVKITKKGVIIK